MCIRSSTSSDRTVANLKIPFVLNLPRHDHLPALLRIFSARAACVLLAALCVPLTFTAAAETNRDTELARVRARLQSLQTELNATQVQRDTVREEINGLERKIGAALNELRGTER